MKSLANDKRMYPHPDLELKPDQKILSSKTRE